MVIDTHTHVPPEADWPFFLAQCRANGVCISVASDLGIDGWAEFPGEAQIRAANDRASRFAQFADGMVMWFAYLSPRHESWRRELDRCVGLGARGVKLWISIKDPDTGSLAAADAVLDEAGTRELPVLLHTYQRTDGNRRGELSLAEFAVMARRHPGTTMIAAHAGGNWRQARGLLAGLDNVFADISGGYPEAGMVESVTADVGAARVLYGSDALGRSMPSQLAKILFADIAEDERRAILAGNAVRALALAEADTARAKSAMASLPDRAEALPLPDLAEDHFCFCGRCCIRDSACEDPASLDAALALRGIRRAFVASAGSFYACDVQADNRCFAESAAGLEHVVALATLQPYAYNWEVVVADAAARFAGAIVLPYLQDWKLDDPTYGPFFEACAAAQLPLWINCALADDRFRPRGTVCRNVSPEELVSFLGQAPVNQYVFQGVPGEGIKRALAGAARDDVRFEISRLTDNSSALIDVITGFGVKSLVLGTEFPFRDLRTVAFTARRLGGYEA